MNNRLDRSLNEMRNEEMSAMHTEENLLIDDAEAEELEQFGERITRAYELSAEPPSRAVIDFADATVSLPEETPSSIAQFNDGVRRRVEELLREQTGAESMGAWVRQRRQARRMADEEAAERIEVASTAYRQFEAGRLPIWRLPAARFARFCRDVGIDLATLLQWARVSLVLTQHVAYGRLDLDNEERSRALEELGAESARETLAEFNQWRAELIAAYGASSEDAAQ